MAADHDASPSVLTAEDKATATLIIPAGYDRTQLTEPLLISVVRAKGVEVTDFTTQAIRTLITEPPEPDDDQDQRVLIASAQPPIHGTDGSIQWFVDEKPDTDAEQPASAPGSTKSLPDEDSDKVSFYERCAFVMVHTGDIVGKVHPAVPGQDGRDVVGGTLPARPGKDATLQIDESILKKADGSLVAQQDGVLYREPGAARIRKLIEIKDYVDFSTGNIDFDGDITIGRGVRDCFIVKATGNIEVKGLIEAATIEAGKDLRALGGFAGREQGNVFTGASLRGRYLDNVHGHVKQDLCIDREIINCNLAVEGHVASPTGSIIGGRVTPTGAVEIGTLGSDAGVHTELILGTVPVLEPFAKHLARIVDSYTRDNDKLTQEQDLINKMSTKGKMTATDKERQTEIMFELSSVSNNLNKAKRTLDNVLEQIAKRRTVDLTVHHVVNPGTILILDDYRYKIRDWVKGPARFFMDGKQFVCQIADAPPQPIKHYADASPVMPAKSAA